MTEQTVSSVRGSTTPSDVEALKEAEVWAIGSPIALGLAAFALPLFIWGVINTSFYSHAQEAFIIPFGIFFGGLGEIAAAMWAFRRREGLEATVFGSIGAFWVSFGALLWMMKAGFLNFGAANGSLVGLFFIGWASIAGIAWLGSMTTRNVPMSLSMLGITAVFGLMAAGNFSGVVSNNVYVAGGWVAVVTSGVAWYGSLAAAVNHVVDKMVLPDYVARPGEPLANIEARHHHLHRYPM